MRRINECFTGKLNELCKKAGNLIELNSKIKPLLPANLREQCEASSFQKGGLILLVQDPVFATELRYLLPELRDRLRSEAELYQLVSIKIVIKAEDKPGSKAKVCAHAISTKAKDSIKKEAQSFAYEPLRLAMMKLAE